MVGKNTYNEGRMEDVRSLERLSRGFFRIGQGETKKVSLKIAVIYLVVGAIWILLSDKVLAFFVNDKETMMFIGMMKGWLYVSATGGLIFALAFTALKRIKTAELELVKSQGSLASANHEIQSAHAELKEYEQKLHHLAYHDQLTGLCNRRSLNERLAALMSEKKDLRCALLFIDIDNFKYVNDTMGHTFGDQLLVKASERLVHLQESSYSVFKLGGDEFIVLMESFKDIEEIERLAVKILKEFKARFEVGKSSLFTTVSIGISVYPDHGVNMDELLKNADIAVYKAKETGRNRIVMYNEPMNEAVTERMYIEKYLRTAMENNEFELYYQPQLDINTNKISGFEALIRWRNPEWGFISPQKFIGIAEDTHLIIPIGEWVFRNACLFLKRLHQQGHTDLNISINISMLQLLQEDFVDMVMETLASMKLNPKQIELEITESILMESYETIAGKLKLLRERGVKIALDDFGKGYSSLNYLKQLPITTLKIDKSFIDTIQNDEKNKSLTNLIVKIGKSMDLCVIAEGVETQEQMDYLVKHKCNKIQGYLFSKPISENAAFMRIREQ